MVRRAVITAAAMAVLLLAICVAKYANYHSAIEKQLRYGMTYQEVGRLATHTGLKIEVANSQAGNYFIDDPGFFGLAGTDVNLVFDPSQRLRSAWGERYFLSSEHYYDVDLGR